MLAVGVNGKFSSVKRKKQPDGAPDDPRRKLVRAKRSSCAIDDRMHANVRVNKLLEVILRLLYASSQVEAFP